MLTILIVDDERLILNGCRVMIERNLKFSFPVQIFTANKAIDALRLLQETEIDLILTDIRMPEIDGFSLICSLRDLCYAGEIVILTSHADFEYARKALRLNISDFLLKPIDQNELERLIISAWQRKQTKEERQREELYQELLSVMLYDFPLSDLSATEETLKTLFPHMYFTVILIPLEAVLVNSPEIRKILKSYYAECYCYLLSSQKLILALCNHPSFRVCLNGLTDLLYPLTCSRHPVAASITSNSILEIHALYTNAVRRLFCRNLFGNDLDMTEHTFFSYQDCIEIFLEQSPSLQEEKLDKYLSSFSAVDTIAPQYLNKIYMSFFENLSLYLKNNGIIREFSTSPPVPLLSVRELYHAILQNTRILKETIRQKEIDPSTQSQVMRILDYIKMHYMEDISLDSVADAMNMNPNYVCSLIRKNLGKSYLSFLHQERIREAKQLLKDPSLTIEEIAKKVGYNSSSQFGRVFRKSENLSASDYRKQ